MRTMRTRFIGVMVLLLAMAVSVVHAQELCEVLVREALEATTDNCETIENANACYGFDSLTASFYGDIADDSFSDPSDFVSVAELQTVRTLPFDEEEEEWGIGYFQIELENATDPLVIMTAGDVIVENDVEAAEDAGLGFMQAFNFTTAGPSDCRNAPNAVYIQGPQEAEVNLLINSTPIRMGSTIVLGTLLDENGTEVMWLGVVEGHAIINPDSPEAVFVEEGTISTAPLTDENGDNPNGENILEGELVPVLDAQTGEPIIGPNGEPFYRRVPIQTFSEPQPITEDGEGIFNWGNFSFINEIPPALVNYVVTVPEVTEDEPIVSEPAPVVVEAVEDAVSPVAEDTNVTECGTQNWCNAGEPWGDGRCNDPDPAVANWYWNAGWYQAQLECGEIDVVPAQYAINPVQATQAVPPNAFTGTYLGCTPSGTLNQLTISFTNIPAGATHILIEILGGGNWLQKILTITPPGNETQVWNIDDSQLPVTGTFRANPDPNSASTPIETYTISGVPEFTTGC